jgi:hypothetical protein
VPGQPFAVPERPFCNCHAWNVAKGGRTLQDLQVYVPNIELVILQIMFSARLITSSAADILPQKVERSGRSNP